MSERSGSLNGFRRKTDKALHSTEGLLKFILEGQVSLLQQGTLPRTGSQAREGPTAAWAFRSAIRRATAAPRTQAFLVPLEGALSVCLCSPSLLDSQHQKPFASPSAVCNSNRRWWRTIRGTAKALFYCRYCIRFVVCCYLIFLSFPLFWGGERCTVEEEDGAARDAGGTGVEQFGVGSPTSKHGSTSH